METFAGIAVSGCSYGLGSTRAIKDETASNDTFKITFFLICLSWKLWRGNVAQNHTPSSPVCSASSHTDYSYSTPFLEPLPNPSPNAQNLGLLLILTTHTILYHSNPKNQYSKSVWTKCNTLGPISPLDSFIGDMYFSPLLKLCFSSDTWWPMRMCLLHIACFNGNANERQF